MELWNHGIMEGFASASPDYETTSQQDNEWGFARLRRQQTTELGLRKASPTTDNRTWASQGFAKRLRRLVVYKKAKRKH